MRYKYYVGSREDRFGEIWEVFRSRETPKQEELPYKFVIGPYDRRLEAKAMVTFGYGNPHFVFPKRVKEFVDQYRQESGNWKEVRYVWNREVLF